MRRPLLSLLLFALALLLLSACGAAGGTPAATTPPTKAAAPTRPAAAATTAPAASLPTSAPAAGAGKAAAATKPAAPALPAAGATAASIPRPAESSRGEPATPAAKAADAVEGRGIPAERPYPCHQPCPPPPPPQPPVREPLRAGWVDDNHNFADYLRYLREGRGHAAWPVDVDERYLIAVLDADQRPVVNSTVRVYAGQTTTFTGRTYANGQTLFFPRAVREAVQATEFTVTAEKDGLTTSQLFRRGDGGLWKLTLDGRAPRSTPTRLDVLFLIDSTGSMGGEIAKIQATLVSIAGRIDQSAGQPRIRYGAVTYRDRGDEYITRKFGFTSDLQSFQGWLNGIRAGGGGDVPESLNEALHVAVEGMDWDAGDAVRLVFLVADAPPHLDYPNDYRYTTEAATAVRKGIKLYTIGASGLDPSGEYVFRQLAQLTFAQYIFITRGGDEYAGGGGPASATNIQSAENNLDDIIVRIVTQELRQAMGW